MLSFGSPSPHGSTGPINTAQVTGVHTERFPRFWNTANGSEITRCIAGTLRKHAESICEENIATLRYASPTATQLSAFFDHPARIIVPQYAVNVGTGFDSASYHSHPDADGGGYNSTWTVGYLTPHPTPNSFVTGGAIR